MKQEKASLYCATSLYCAAHGGRLTKTRRKSPIGRGLVVCESCRRKQAKAKAGA